MASKTGKGSKGKTNKQIQQEKKAAEARRRLMTGAGALAVILVVVIAVFVARGAQSPGSGGADATAFAQDKDPIRGGKTAAVTIQEFGDFQCPACNAMRFELDKLFMKYGDKIRLEYENFPLPQHKWGMPTAIAGECALEQSEEKYWDFHEAIYDAQQEWESSGNDAFIKRIAKESGLGMAEFDKCFASQQAKDKVDLDLQEGQAVQISSTPTFFINGERFVGQGYEEFKTIIDQALASASK